MTAWKEHGSLAEQGVHDGPVTPPRRQVQRRVAPSVPGIDVHLRNLVCGMLKHRGFAWGQSHATGVSALLQGADCPSGTFSCHLLFTTCC